MNQRNEAVAYLDGLSTLAKRGFESIQEATKAVLQLVCEQLDVRTSFFAHFSPEQLQFTILAVHTMPGGCDIAVGGRFSQSSHFPLLMNASSDEPAPLILENLRIESLTASVQQAMYIENIGCYIGVPVVLSDGLLFGVLCAIDSENRQLTFLQVKLLMVLARLLATQVERDQQLTERRWAESELSHALMTLQTVNTQRERLDRMQSDFVSIINHEFRTSLTGIQGFSELMLSDDFSFHEVKEYAADIHSDAKRLCRIISQMLDMEQMKSGQMPLTLEAIDINNVIIAAVQEIRSVAPQYHYHLELSEVLPLFWGDRSMLVQVFTNLLSNAVKFSVPDSAITLRSGVEGNELHMEVEDQGVGIAADALEAVFQPYYNETPDTQHYVGGTGLGLALVHQCLQMHGGHIWAESILGKGSIFHILLPLPDQET